VLGLWSFDGPLSVPGWLGDYDHTSRRLVRLGHIALVGLGILDILLAHELARSALRAGARRTASAALIAGNVSLPLALFAAGAHRPLKVLMAPSALCVFAALLLAAYGARARAAPPGDDARVPPAR
jgi:hypothetical protein